MFYLIEENGYLAELAVLKRDFSNGAKIYNNHGEMLLWLRKRGIATKIVLFITTKQEIVYLEFCKTRCQI